MTQQGTLRDVTGAGHEALPVPGTAYTTTGFNAGRAANLRNPYHYPVEALCACGTMIRCEAWLPAVAAGQWIHTGRVPGDELP